jgi:hypothetical protein
MKEKTLLRVLLAFGPYPVSVAMDDALGDGKSDAGSFKFGGTVQTLEDAEGPVIVFHVKADAVVLHVICLPSLTSMGFRWRDSYVAPQTF